MVQDQLQDSAQSKPTFYTVAEAAAFLRVSHSTIYRYLERKVLRTSQAGFCGHHRISAASVHALAGM